MFISFFFLSLVLLVAGPSHALTDEEIDAFGATASDSFPARNAFARATRQDDGTILIEASGVPDHEIFPGTSRPWYVNQPGDCKMVGSKFQHRVIVPNEPVQASVPACVPEFAGIATNGVAIYFGVWDSPGVKTYVDTLFGDGTNPPNECLDQCGAHPNPRGMYHYHGFTSLTDNVEARPCFAGTAEELSTPGPSGIVGVAFDGYAVYGPYDEDGNELLSADLDECHGKIDNDGVYRYRVTRDFPYVFGCLRGEVIDEQVIPTIAYGSEVDTCAPGFGENLEVFTACCKYTRANIQTVIPGYEDNELSQVQYGSCSPDDISSACRCIDNNRDLQEALNEEINIPCSNYFLCLVDDDCPGNEPVAGNELIESGSQFQTCVILGTNIRSNRVCVQTTCLDGSVPSCADGSDPTNPDSVSVTPDSPDYNDWVQPMQCSDGTAATCPEGSATESPTVLPTSSPTSRSAPVESSTPMPTMIPVVPTSPTPEATMAPVAPTSASSPYCVHYLTAFTMLGVTIASLV